VDQSVEATMTRPQPVAPEQRRFPAFHPSDRNFFLIFLALCWLGVLMGFVPAALKRYDGHATYPAPLILEIHAVAFTAWMFLLTAQIALIRTRSPKLHMKLGMIAVALVPIMAVTSALSERYGQRFRLIHEPPGDLPFLIIAIFDVLFFTALACAAIVARKKPSAHKRLILLATTIIVGAAYGRWWADPLYNLFGEGYAGLFIYTFAGTDMLLAGAVGYDWLSRKQIHLVYKVAVPAILLGELATTIIYHSPNWLPIARALIGR
jgi:uncharacterized membrane protein YozB (DUF420 family)